MKGSGKTHLTKLFILNALREVETNPHAKLIVYEPKREFYAWLSSLGLQSKLSYFMPSDVRSVALDFTADYPSDQDSRTLAHAFYPEEGQGEHRFWGDSLRTIYAQVLDAIKTKLCRADLRLMCSVLEDEELTRAVLKDDPYLRQAQCLVKKRNSSVSETAENIQLTIQSRMAAMKVMAAHLDLAEQEMGLFSLREFVKKPKSGVLAVSKDSTYGLIQDPMNAVLFWRLIELLDSEQYDKRRKVFVVIDEFPTLAGDKPCPGIKDMFLRLRSRGVTVLITYQSYMTLQDIYGKHASEILGQCTNVLYLRQADVDSAKYAAEDLGWERGYEQGPPSWTQGENGSSFTMHHERYDRPIFDHTHLMGLLPARDWHGLVGAAKTGELAAKEPERHRSWGSPQLHHYPKTSERPWLCTYSPEVIAKIPARDKNIEEYLRRDPDLGEDFKAYIELMRSTQRLRPLSAEERSALCGSPDGRLGLPPNLDEARPSPTRPRQRPATPKDILG